MTWWRLAVGALLLVNIYVSAQQVPCLNGRKGTTRVEVLRDDWACSTLCMDILPSSWSSACRMCCPKFIGGDGDDGPGVASKPTTETNAKSSEGSTEETPSSSSVASSSVASSSVSSSTKTDEQN